MPHASVAVHVRVITTVSPQLPETEDSVSVILTELTEPHESVPVALPVLSELVSSVHSTEVSAGKFRVGGVVSTTLIVCDWIALSLPHASVADHFLVRV